MDELVLAERSIRVTRIIVGIIHTNADQCFASARSNGIEQCIGGGAQSDRVNCVSRHRCTSVRSLGINAAEASLVDDMVLCDSWGVVSGT